MTRKDTVFLTIISILGIVLAVLGGFFSGLSALFIFLAIVVLATMIEIYRRLHSEFGNLIEHVKKPWEISEAFRTLTEENRRSRRARENEYRQIESLFSLFSVIKPRLPFPDMRGWAASPDLLKMIAETILKNKPGLVFETGSGVSTLVVAYCLQELGSGSIISLEHDAKCFAVNRDLITSHGLADIATIIYAPLKKHKINGQEWLWYDTECFAIRGPIDLLIVDGPPGSTQQNARYPVLPLLYEHLGDSVRIIMDDGGREDEKCIAALWEKEYRVLVPKFLDLEKGAYIIEKRKG
jgi:hypothetical protein